MKALPIAAMLLALCACTSPEQDRARGGAGADMGLRGKPVVMHEGSRPYDGTPRLIPGEAPPMEPAQQARSLSVKR